MSDPNHHPPTLTLLGREGHGSPTASREFLHRAIDLALDELEGASQPVGHPGVSSDPGDIAAAIHDVDLDAPVGERALSELSELWFPHAVWYHHPRYLSHLNCPVTLPAVAADLIAVITNTAVESWDQATAAAVIEDRLIDFTAGLIGFPSCAGGTFTSGGTQSNLQALTIARDKAPGPRPVFLATANAHYSVARAAHLLGLGPEGVASVACDRRGRMDTLDLERVLDRVRAQGMTPAAVIATAGTTDRGAIDPLETIAELCERHRVHLHVDAAYGGALLCLPDDRRLAGIERADSVTIDFHKGFFQPVACSALLLREAGDLGHIRVNADYLNPEDSGRLNLADRSLQTTRRFDALKLWVTLRSVGTAPIGEAFDQCRRTASAVAAELAARPDVELFEAPQLSTVIFRPTAPVEIDRLRERLFDSGTAAVAATTLAGERWLKFTLLDPTLEVANILSVVDLICDPAPLTSTIN